MKQIQKGLFSLRQEQRKRSRGERGSERALESKLLRRVEKKERDAQVEQFPCLPSAKGQPASPQWRGDALVPRCSTHMQAAGCSRGRRSPLGAGTSSESTK